jgi:hypothetical protein
MNSIAFHRCPSVLIGGRFLFKGNGAARGIADRSEWFLTGAPRRKTTWPKLPGGILASRCGAAVAAYP